jgi:hypothetical protein
MRDGDERAVTGELGPRNSQTGGKSGGQMISYYQVYCRSFQTIFFNKQILQKIVVWQSSQFQE